MRKKIMKFNCSDRPKNFLGDNLNWEDIAKALWKVLDDIDTLPDMLHPSEYKMADKCWRMMVKRAEKRHQYLLSDGYELTKHLPPTGRYRSTTLKKENYKCTKCGLEIVIVKVKSQNLPKAECQDCGTMTMRPISP